MSVIDDIRKLYWPVLQRYPGDYTVKSVLEEQARILAKGHREGNVAVCFQIESWFPQLIGARAKTIMKTPFPLDDARLTIAREHGFPDWEHVERLGDAPLDARFEQAVDAVVSGQLETLRSLLEQQPSLTRTVSSYGHRATLLHYVAANGVESWRQTVPPNAADITRTLIRAGADVGSRANIYGGSDTMGLLLSSAHPQAAGLTEDIAAVLRSAAGSPGRSD